MRLNADFSRAAVLNAIDHEWVPSPQAGVDRIMLDRIGDEVARATSIVRYARGSEFSRHEHACGEEFLVLDGVFSDEHGDYPQGSYVRNPPGSGHSPFSRDGCRILVKLRQFDPEDLAHIVVDTGDHGLWTEAGSGEPATLPLHRFGTEIVRMVRLQDGADFSVPIGDGGLELLVVEGSVNYGDQSLAAESWLRLPAGMDLRLHANGATLLWVKSGHLPNG